MAKDKKLLVEVSKLNFIFLPYNFFLPNIFLLLFGIKEEPWHLPAPLRSVHGDGDEY